MRQEWKRAQEDLVPKALEQYEEISAGLLSRRRLFALAV